MDLLNRINVFYADLLNEMVARSFSVQDVSYSRLLHVPDDDRDFITLEELKPAIGQPNLQQHYQPTYYELSNMVE